MRKHRGKWKVALAAMVLGGSLHASVALAVPILSLDTDPDTPGIQSSADIALGTTFYVDVVIEGVEASAALNGFEFDLDFNPAILSARSVTDGGFLLAPVLFAEKPDVTAPDVNFAEFTLGFFGAVGDGVLATIVFDAIATGTSVLVLNDVILSDPEGFRIAGVALNDGMVTVVPEPATLMLLALGLAVLAARCRGRLFPVASRVARTKPIRRRTVIK